MVGGRKIKQGVTIVWEKDIGTLKVGGSYTFNRLVVYMHLQRKNNFVASPFWASVESIEDIGSVAEDKSNIDDDNQLLGAKVIGVQLE